MIRVIHTSNLHLDAEVFPKDKRRSELRKKELRALFANIMMYARDKQVDVILFCGDLIDSRQPEEETKRLLVREFEKTPQTDIFIACGRHDPLRQGSFWRETTFSENVHIFGREEVDCFEVPSKNLRVYGFSFCGRNHPRAPLALPPSLDKSYINLFTGYCDLSGDENLAPVSEEQIARASFDYAAFGSSHTPSELLSVNGCNFAVAGSPEGVDFSDCGKKSMRIAAIEKTGGELLLKSKSVVISNRRMEVFEKEIGEGESSADISSQALAFMREKGLDAETYLEVRVKGKVPTDFRFDKGAFEKLRSHTAYLLLSDNTTVLCPESIADKEDFKAVFAFKVAEKLKDEELRSRALKIGFETLEEKKNG